MKESAKFMTKAKASPTRDNALMNLKKKIGIVEQFIAARKLFETQPVEAISLCMQLLERGDIEVHFLILSV